MTQEEIINLKSFVAYYKDQHTKISHKQSEVEALTIEIEGMLNGLMNKRKEEEEFIEDLKAKYSDAELKKTLAELS